MKDEIYPLSSIEDGICEGTWESESSLEGTIGFVGVAQVRGDARDGIVMIYDTISKL